VYQYAFEIKVEEKSRGKVRAEKQQKRAGAEKRKSTD